MQDEENFFNTQERQSIVHHLLYSIRMRENEVINGIKFRTDQSLSRHDDHREDIFCERKICWVLVQRGLEKELIRQIIPLHDKEQLNHLREVWVWPKNVFKAQPIGKEK